MLPCLAMCAMAQQMLRPTRLLMSYFVPTWCNSMSVVCIALPYIVFHCLVLHCVHNLCHHPTDCSVSHNHHCTVKMMCAGYCCYGSATEMVVTYGHGVQRFTLGTYVRVYTLPQVPFHA